jgi:hypothetical protein
MEAVAATGVALVTEEAEAGAEGEAGAEAGAEMG